MQIVFSFMFDMLFFFFLLRMEFDVQIISFNIYHVLTSVIVQMSELAIVCYLMLKRLEQFLLGRYIMNIFCVYINAIFAIPSISKLIVL